MRYYDQTRPFTFVGDSWVAKEVARRHPRFTVNGLEFLIPQTYDRHIVIDANPRRGACKAGNVWVSTPKDFPNNYHVLAVTNGPTQESHLLYKLPYKGVMDWDAWLSFEFADLRDLVVGCTIHRGLPADAAILVIDQEFPTPDFPFYGDLRAVWHARPDDDGHIEFHPIL